VEAHHQGDAPARIAQQSGARRGGGRSTPPLRSPRPVFGRPIHRAVAKPAMQPMSRRNRKVIQASWVVDDVAATALQWVRTTGIGPFFVFEHIPVEEPSYRGQPVAIDFSVAIAQAGEVQIELVAQHDDGPSAYRDLIARGSSGFHHVALYSMDYDADLQSYVGQGYAAAVEGKFAGKRFAYIDTSASIGCMVELIEDSPVQREFFARIAAAARDWDGREPIRIGFQG
jgi:hypothetical protein